MSDPNCWADLPWSEETASIIEAALVALVGMEKSVTEIEGCSFGTFRDYKIHFKSKTVKNQDPHDEGFFLKYEPRKNTLVGSGMFYPEEVINLINEKFPHAYAYYLHSGPSGICKWVDVTEEDLREAVYGGSVLTCDDYRLICIAGPNQKNLSITMRNLMKAHEAACGCMKPKGYAQDCCDTPVTEDMEANAMALIAILDNDDVNQRWGIGVVRKYIDGLIDVERQADCYRACIAGRKGFEGKGRTPKEAIGDVCIKHPDALVSAVWGTYPA